MNAVPHSLPMTLEQFFGWPGHNEGRFEFDGLRPVAMTGSNPNHSRVALAIYAMLQTALRGVGWEAFVFDGGIMTSGDKVRYPDVLVAPAGTGGEARTIHDPRVVFEVVSNTSGRIDRVEKAEEYEAVSSILRHVIVARTRVHLAVLERGSGDRPFSSGTLGAGQVLRMPEIGVELPVDAIYEDVDLTRRARRVIGTPED